MSDNSGGGESVFAVMESLQREGWLVVLKCIPSGLPWIAPGDPSEYGGSAESVPVSIKPWCCEISWMGEDVGRRGEFGTGDSPMDAVLGCLVAKDRAEQYEAEMNKRSAAKKKALDSTSRYPRLRKPESVDLKHDSVRPFTHGRTAESALFVSIARFR